MQIIIVSRHLKAARTITIMPRHLLAVAALFLFLLFAGSAFFSYLSLHFRLPLVENLMLSMQQQEARQTRDYLSNNLQMMATRLGELQGRLLQLDSLGERVSGLAGIKRDAAATTTAAGPGQGGPFLPQALSASELQQEIERLAQAVEQRADELIVMEMRLLEKRVDERLLPTTLPVRNGVIGSSFGYRNDPFVGLRARHDGLDFSAPSGTPVLAAADGVVLATTYHPEFGNLIEVDHGGGLTTHYAHLSAVNVAEAQIVRAGERIGAVGSTGRSTGPHLHFEVRMFGVAQNPARFLDRRGKLAGLSR